MVAATATENTARTAVAVATMQAYLKLTPTVPPPKLVGQGDFGVWRYTAYSYRGALTAQIKYDTSTAESLYAYAKANQQLCTQLADRGDTAEVRITFRNYVEPDKYRSWVKANGLRVQASVLRLTDTRAGYPPDITASTGPEGDDPLPQGGLNDMLKQVGGIYMEPQTEGRRT